MKEAPLGMASLGDFNVAVADDGKATITLESILVDPRPKISYIWRVRVTDDAKNLLTEVWYDKKVFKVGATGGMEPKFNEVINLPDGASRIAVTLHEFPDDPGLEAFKRLPEKDRALSRAFHRTTRVNDWPIPPTTRPGPGR